MLLRIPLATIVIGDKPSSRWQDSRVVEQDLARWMSFTRIFPAIPHVRLRLGVFRLIEGHPFVRAALRAEPPIEVVLCACHCSERAAIKAGATPVTKEEAHALAWAPDEPTDELCMVFFHDPAPTQLRPRIAAILTSYLMRWRQRRAPEWPRRNSPLEWLDSGQVVRWTWTAEPRGMGLPDSARQLSELRRVIFEEVNDMRPVRSFCGYLAWPEQFNLERGD